MALGDPVLGVPENYATPEQIKAVREFYSSMMPSGQDLEIRSPWQGVANIVRALMGGYGMNSVRQWEKQNLEHIGEAKMPTNAGPGRQPPLPGVLGGETPAIGLGGAKAAYAPEAGGGYNPDAASAAISKIESGGKYDLLGPKTRTGDRAYGKYQVMGKNVPEWTTAALGKSMTPDEFLASPEAQEAVFKHRFGQYAQKYGPEGAARAWFAGEKGMNSPNRRDQLGTTVASYANQFNKGYGGPDAPGLPGSALAFNGEPVNGPGPMSNALMPQQVAQRGGGGPTYPVPRTVPTEPGTATGAPPPGFFPQRPHYTREQMRLLQMDPRVTPAEKEKALEEFKHQNDPLQMESTFGTWLQLPNGQTHFVPKAVTTPVESMGTKYNQPFVYDPVTGQLKSVPMTGLFGSPTQAPAPEAPDFYASPGQAGNVSKEGLPPEITQGQSAPVDQPPGPLGATPPAPEAPPDALHGIDRALKGGRGMHGLDRSSKGGKGPLAYAPPDESAGVGPLAYAPPDGGDVTAPIVPPGKAGTAGKTAQAGGIMENLRDFGLESEARKKAIDVAQQSFQKKYDNLTTIGQRAQSSRSILEFARKLVDDPQFYSGAGAGLVQDGKKLMYALGMGTNNPTLANESFTKLISGQLLEDMKISLSGLGQIRVAEIELLQKAAANMDLTQPANRLILDLTIKAHDQAAFIGQIAQKYGEGVRWDSNGKVIRDANGRAKVDPNAPKIAGLDATISAYLKKHPILTESEQKFLQDQIANKNKDYGGPEPRTPKYQKERPKPKATNPPAPPTPTAPGPGGVPAAPKGYE